MFYEMKKIWCRKIVYCTFIILCLLQIASIVLNHEERFQAESNRIYTQYEGQITTSWKQQFQQDDHIHQAQLNRMEQNAYRSEPAYSALRLLANWEESVQSTISNVQQMYQEHNPSIDPARIQRIYAPLLHKETVMVSYDAGYRLGASAYAMLKKTLPILLVILLSTIFSQERDCHMQDLLLVTKQGLHKIKRNKYVACMISGILAWAAFVLCSGIAIGLTTGFQGSFIQVQNFIDNASPYLLNNLQYVALISGGSLLAVIVCSAFLTALAAMMKEGYVSMLAAFLFVVLPVYNSVPTFAWLRFMPGNLVDANALFYQYEGCKVWQLIIPSWLVALIICLMLWLLSTIVLIMKKDVEKDEHRRRQRYVRTHKNRI